MQVYMLATCVRARLCVHAFVCICVCVCGKDWYGTCQMVARFIGYIESVVLMSVFINSVYQISHDVSQQGL